VATPSTDADRTRGLRDRPLGRVAILLAILVVAFVASRSCASVDTPLSQDEAVAIAKKQVSYTPEKVQIRLLKRGIKSHAFWGVSLSTVNPDGSLGRVTVVVVDAETGDVAEIRGQP
jgi:uncharacterized membrane protein YkoI